MRQILLAGAALLVLFGCSATEKARAKKVALKAANAVADAVFKTIVISLVEEMVNGTPSPQPELAAVSAGLAEQVHAEVLALQVPYTEDSPEYQGYLQQLLVLQGVQHVPAVYYTPDSTSDFAQRWTIGYNRAEADVWAIYHKLQQ